MNPTYRIAIPVALAALAAAANFVLLKRATATTAVLVLTRGVAAGEELKDADFAFAKVRADPAVFRAAYTAGDLTLLIGTRLRREAQKGELVMRSDVEVESQNYELQADERDAELMVPSSQLRPGLTTNARIEFSVAGGDSPGQQLDLGPYRLLAIKTVPSQHARESYVRVLFAVNGRDVKTLDKLKAENPDPFRLAGATQLHRVGTAGGKPAPAGNRVAAAPSPQFGQ